METAGQMRYWLWSFLIGGVLSFVVANVVCPFLPINHKNPGSTLLIGIGSGCLFWWVSYILITKAVERRSDRRKRENELP